MKMVKKRFEKSTRRRRCKIHFMLAYSLCLCLFLCLLSLLLYCLHNYRCGLHQHQLPSTKHQPSLSIASIPLLRACTKKKKKKLFNIVYFLSFFLSNIASFFLSPLLCGVRDPRRRGAAHPPRQTHRPNALSSEPPPGARHPPAGTAVASPLMTDCPLRPDRPSTSPRPTRRRR